MVQAFLPSLWKSLPVGGDVEVSVFIGGQQEPGGGDQWVLFHLCRTPARETKHGLYKLPGSQDEMRQIRNSS